MSNEWVEPQPLRGLDKIRRRWAQLRNRFGREQDVAQPTLEQRKQHILESHREIASILLGLAAEVNNNVGVDNRDSAGWRYYGFDPITTTQQQVEMQEGPLVDPLFSIEYHPQRENIHNETLPLTMSVYLYQYGGPNPVFLEVYPMNSDHIEWTRLSTDFYSGERHTRPSVTRNLTSAQIYSEVDTYIPEYTHREDDVCTLGVPVTQMDNAVEHAEFTFQQIASVLKGIQEGRYRARVFGNSHDSPMEPRFFAPRPQIMG